MKNSLTLKKSSLTMLWLCFAGYAVISMSKTAFTSSMAAIINDGIFTNSQAGIISACFYFLYGLAQLFCSKIIDNVSPVFMLAFAFGSAALSSIGMAVANNFILMLIIWSLCGLLQFATWPCIIKILSDYLLEEHKHKAMTVIAFAYCLGNLFNYITASVILNFTSWRIIFVLNGLILGIFLLIWLLRGVSSSNALISAKFDQANKNHKNNLLNPDPTNISYTKLLVKSGMLLILIPAFIRCTLDLGIKSWAPTIMVQNYGISPSFATSLTTVLMVINLSGVFLANYIYPKFFKNAISAINFCFIISLPITLVMLLIGKIPLWAVVLLLILVTTIMYCGNQLFNVVLPLFFTKYNRSGSIAGILNSAASFGAVASNFGYGFLADKFGWTGTIASWSIMGVVSIIFCILSIPLWQRFTKR